jgi:glycine/D-amino acid oxidase-like deaminating enzyme
VREIQTRDEIFVTKDLEARVPAAAGPIVEARVCMYTMSEDEHFVVDTHPQHGRIHFACGFSGHGFKFAPAIGEGLADLALEGGSRLEMNFLSSDRFTNG